ncbi:hypothetical protein GTR02_11710 [Kineococcus sp. R8]|uniref:hypothetical protein n=1 Tax=Kineococcus siccus TaxID=2696567 RepID=UPI0014135E45|nr:hypothetical protein [Kineococcus siccus]NAZ82487.1 hypothetical protein [Kineococcus siccus]
MDPAGQDAAHHGPRPPEFEDEFEVAVNSIRNAQPGQRVIDLRAAPTGAPLLAELRAAYDERLDLLEVAADDEALAENAARVDSLEARCRAPRPVLRRRRSGPDPATFLG